MRKFDLKSLAAGFIIGTLGLTTVFGAAGIQSAALSNTKVTLNGALLSLGQPLISVKMDDGQDASLYAPVNEVLEKLGYTEINEDEQKVHSIASTMYLVLKENSLISF